MDSLSSIRAWILAVLVFGLLGTMTELLLLRHYEDRAQFVPLVLLVLALAFVGWHAARPSAANVRALQAAMTMFLFAGIAGIVFHFQGAAAFQRETNPSQHGWDLITKVMRAQAPPVLAPGVMMQLGLTGLIYTYRHPALAGGFSSRME